MITKKGLTVLLLLTLLFTVSHTLIAGGEQEAAGKVMEIRFMSPWTAGSTFWDYLNQMIDEFNAAHPNITIVHDALPSADLRTKITVEMAAGNPPHCAWNILSYAREFEKAGQIIDWKPIYDDPRHKEYRQWFDEKVLMEEANPRGRVQLSKHFFHGEHTEAIEPSKELAEAFYTCTVCDACSCFCPSQIKASEIIQEGREKIFAAGKTPEPVAAIRDNILKSLISCSATKANK